MKHIRPRQCPYCGGTEFVTGVQEYHGSILGENEWAAGQPLRHVVCLDCGCVVMSYVAQPEKLLSGKHRKERQASREDM
jgi:hypothetical protein